MRSEKFFSLECVVLVNTFLEVLVTKSVGPRIISLSLVGGDNLFAELPDAVMERPDGKLFHFYGGHRLWHAPESFPRTYYPDNQPVNISITETGCVIKQEIEDDTGIQKKIEINLNENKPQMIIHHTLVNQGQWPLTCASWAITQFKLGGVAILPQPQAESGLLPNRSIILWPYSDINNSSVSWGNRFILVNADMISPFKIGFPNPSGWLAYWNHGTLFVKRAKFNPQGNYFDFGSSSECYCDDRFLELETLGPSIELEPEQSTTHTEIWEIYPDVEEPVDETAAEKIAEQYIEVNFSSI